MIRSVKLKNFRQHKELYVDFSNGLNTLRGANEQGKTTVFEAVSYALFGVKGARNNDLTTWGEPEGSYRVELELQVAGSPVTVVRSPRGAEVVHQSGRVTGQTDTTRYLEQVLELKPGMGHRLMFASQGNIRGVLQAGGAETTRMIEQLADFDLIDKVVDHLQENESTGNTSWLEQSRERVEGKITEFTLPPEPTQEGYENGLEGYQRDIAACETLLDCIRQDLKETTDNLDRLQGDFDKRDRLQQDVLRWGEACETARSQLAYLPEVAEISDVETRTAELRAEVRRQTEQQRVNEVINQLSTLNVKYVDKSRKTLRTELRELEQGLEDLSNERLQLVKKITQTEAELLNGTCSFCGQDFSQVPEVVEKNQGLEVELKALRAQLGSLEVRAEEAAEATKNLRAACSVPDITLDEDYVDFDTNFTPPKPSLKAGLSFSAVDIPKANAALAEFKAAVAAAEGAKEARTRLEGDLENHTARLVAAQEALKVVPSVDKADLDALRQRRDVLNSDLAARSAELTRAERALESFGYAWKEKVAKWEQAKKEESELKEELGQILAQMETMQFNNQLIKRLRSVKPEIANMVWATLLGTVSKYFSIMRGTPSVVSKVSSDFLVDGRSVESLSGSTLDVLGLAIRIALIKTFLPATKILLLDEPFAACDLERQTTSLGFLLGLGFDQVLVITHEDSSETVSSHHVELN